MKRIRLSMHRRLSRPARAVHEADARRSAASALVHLASCARQGLSGILYPPICLGCGKRLGHPHGILCVSCLDAPDLADTFEVERRLERLPPAREALDHAFALWIFDKGGMLQGVHHALKYGNRPTYGLVLGEAVGRAYRRTAPEMPDLVAAIPLHRTRLYERGYNQSERLATGAGHALEVPVASGALVRPRPTRTQTRLSREKRWANLDGAFQVPDTSIVAGRRILLVDDVLTTGSTAGAAARALKTAGARAVDLAALSMART